MNIKKNIFECSFEKKELQDTLKETREKNAASAKISLRNGMKYIAGIIFALIFDVGFAFRPWPRKQRIFPHASSLHVFNRNVVLCNNSAFRFSNTKHRGDSGSVDISKSGRLH